MMQYDNGGNVIETNDTAEILARLEKLEAMIAPIAAFVDSLEVAVKSHPLARTMFGG